jgi:hypothetical protein
MYRRCRGCLLWRDLGAVLAFILNSAELGLGSAGCDCRALPFFERAFVLEDCYWIPLSCVRVTNDILLMSPLLLPLAPYNLRRN